MKTETLVLLIAGGALAFFLFAWRPQPTSTFTEGAPS